jgi:hypothetical protein
MANKFGPTRGELIFRSAFSAAGLALLAVALWLRGIPQGPGLIEVLGMALLVFGGTLGLSVLKLIRRDHP